jgi:hypothetical protein
MGWSIKNIPKWSGHANEPAYTDTQTQNWAKKKISLKIFFSRTETGRVKKVMVF